MANPNLDRRRFVQGVGMLAAVSSAQSASAETMGTEISLNNAAIHQEVTFPADVGRVYQLLTIADRFDRIVRLSAAMATVGPSLQANPTQIDARPGGTFTLFGGYIRGFTLGLVQNKLLVQAWRSESWSAGLISIVRFALTADGSQTVLTFDHVGFPNGEADHLAAGWHGNYWEPLRQVLSDRN